MGTPNDEIWPGVGKLPDYKPTFPQWSKQDIAWIVTTLDEDGIDLLQVSLSPAIIVITLQALPCQTTSLIDNVHLQSTLTYDSAKRISGN